MDVSVYHYDAVDSTNTQCRRLAAEGVVNAVVTADCQTAGRGRMGRSFQSPPGLGLYLSVLCIKCGNDLYYQGKKVCGILTESAFRPDGTPDWVIVGIGVNVSQTAADFSPDVAAIATSLRMELKGDVSRDALAQALTAQLAALHDSALPCPSLWREDYCARCVNVGQRVRLTRDGAIRGAVAEGIDPQYGLTVRYDDGSEETLRGGEVSVRGLYGYSE